MAQSNATQTFTCALTGQSPLTDPVVTPSGYVCSRKLLLTKLSENGGVDPFDAAGTRRLDESALIELSTSAGTNAGAAAPPRPPKATSLPSLLGMLQNEFDAVLLELYDTRKALEETRRELSSALYQNDAAVRVVARLVQERDEARMKLEEFLAAGVAPSAEPQKRGRDDEAGGDAPAKKAKTDEEATADEGPADLTKIPESELSAMTKTWKTLSKSRKSIAKLKRSEEATNKNEKTLTDLADGSEKKVNLGKSSAKAGVLCIASFKSSSGAEYIVTGGHDKSAIVYNATTGQIAATLTGAGKDVTAVHGLAFEESMLIATGSVDGYVRLYTVPLSGDGEPTLLGSAELAKGTPVNVTVHPSSTVEEGRVLLASSEGIIELYKWSAQAESLKLLTQLGGSDEETKYSSGCMHPDGLIYIAGTAAGELIIWDLKTQAIAGTLKGHDGNAIDVVTMSENGYHVATSASDSISIWDLRKLKLVTSFAPADLGAVTSLTFDPTASYLAYSGVNGTKVCVAKDWERVVCTLTPSKSGRKGKKTSNGGGVVWGGEGLGLQEGEGGNVWLATGCDGERPVRFWGIEE